MEHFKGRGAQMNTRNPFLQQEYKRIHLEALDEALLGNTTTRYFEESPKKIINKVDSPDLNLEYSMNPYQGCEHGCIYCYARNSHQYWGWSAGLDFERNIIVKKNAPETLEKQLRSPNWVVKPIMLSGNTDCYQPIERKLRLTRELLKILLKYQHPVSIITKNSLVLRDVDLLAELNKRDLIQVNVSITTLDEQLRQKLEPRTTTATQRLKVVQELAAKEIPVNVMVAPIIPALNSHEMPAIIRRAAKSGASSCGYTMVRLNGAIATLFTDWLKQNFPDRAEKVLNQIAACHGGKLGDSRYGKRMKGEGEIAQSIASMFQMARRRYMKNRNLKKLNTNAFKRNGGVQLELYSELLLGK